VTEARRGRRRRRGGGCDSAAGGPGVSEATVAVHADRFKLNEIRVLEKKIKTKAEILIL
jgi:hypothetical protein